MSEFTAACPVVVDDDSTGQTGTVGDVAWYSAFRGAIDDKISSVANPTQSPAETSDEVVTARGSKSSLDARLSVSLSATGALIPDSTVLSIATMRNLLGAKNWVNNGDFSIWHAGDTSAPTCWTLAGSGAAIVRCGSGFTESAAPADTNRKDNMFCPKVTYGSAEATLTQTLLSVASFSRADKLKSRMIGFGAWVKSATANIARIRVYDGVLTTNTTYHTGGGSWEYLGSVHTISASGTTLTLAGVVGNTGSAYFSGISATESDISLGRELEAETVYGHVHLEIPGIQVAGTSQRLFTLRRPGLIKDVQAYLISAPAGGSLTFDINTWDGAAYTSIFVAAMTIAAAKLAGTKQPDGAWARRCITPLFTDTLAAGNMGSIDIDSIPATPGTGLGVDIGIIQFCSPLERFRAFNEIG